MNLDIRTLLIGDTAIVITLAFLMLYVGVTRRLYPGAFFWVVGTIINAIGFTLLVLRGQIPDVISVVVGSGFLVAVLLCHLIGVRQFLGYSRGLIRGDIVVTALLFAFFNWYFWVEPLVSMRIIIFNLIAIYLCSRVVWSMVKVPLWWKDSGVLVVVMASCLLLFTYIWRFWMQFKAEPVDALLNDVTVEINLLLVPVVSILVVFGYLQLLTSRTENELRIIQQQAMTLANKDSLTGLWNRRFAEERMVEEFNLSKRYHSVFTLVMADLDHFKTINDKYGHGYGDKVLIKVANTLKQQLRTNDVVVRWGGEEFLLLLPATELKMAEELAQRLCQAIRDIECLPPNGTELSLTISLGVVQSREEELVEDLIGRADAALYRAKAAGRNRYELG